jgi:hypothetical protein
MISEANGITGPGPVRPSKPSERIERSRQSSESQAPDRVRTDNSGPLEDTVEISEEGRRLARAEGYYPEEGVGADVEAEVSGNWLSSGYMQARDLLDQA